MKPGDGDTNWSTDIRYHGLVAVLSSLQYFCHLILHCRRVAFANMYALQVGMLQFSRCLAITKRTILPTFASTQSTTLYI